VNLPKEWRLATALEPPFGKIHFNISYKMSFAIAERNLSEEKEMLR